MNIRCDRCGAEYVFDDAQVGGAGAPRCTRCGHSPRVERKTLEVGTRGGTQEPAEVTPFGGQDLARAVRPVEDDGPSFAGALAPPAPEPAWAGGSTPARAVPLKVPRPAERRRTRGSRIAAVLLLAAIVAAAALTAVVIEPEVIVALFPGRRPAVAAPRPSAAPPAAIPSAIPSSTRSARTTATTTETAPSTSTSTETPTSTRAPTASPALAPAPQRNELKALLAEAKRLRLVGRTDAALSLYVRASAQEPNNADALAGRGLCYLDLSQYAPAVASFQAALEEDPRHGEALMGLAETFRYEGRRAEAVKYYEEFLAAHPQGEDAVAARNAIQALKE